MSSATRGTVSSVSRGRGRSRGSRRTPITRNTSTAESRTFSMDTAIGTEQNNQGNNSANQKTILDIGGTCSSCQSLPKITAERDANLEELNEYKQQLEEKRNTVLELELSLKLFKQKIISMEKELESCRLEIHNLTQLNQELQVNGSSCTPSKRRKKMEEQLRKTVDKKYMSIAFQVERLLPERVSQDTMERVLTDSNLTVKNWNGRMERNSSCGVTIPGIGTIAPYSPIDISLVHDYYIPSANSIPDFISQVVFEVLHQLDYSTMTEETKTEIMEALSTDKTLVQRTKQIVSDTVGRRKRQSKDLFFDLYNYKSLKTSYDRTDKPLYARVDEIKIAKERLIKMNVEGQVDYSWWRMAPSSQLYIVDDLPQEMTDEEAKLEIFEPHEANNRFSGDTFRLFRTETRVHVLQKFVGFDYKDGINNSSDSSILAVTRLDAWMVTVISLLKDTDNKGGARQKEYANVYTKHLRLATNQLLGEIRCFVNYWCPCELQIPTVTDNDSRSALLNMTRSATIIVQLPSTGEIYIALKASWFNEFICSDIGHVHDCYLAKISRTWDEILFLGAPFEHDIIDPIDYDPALATQNEV